MTFGQAIQSGFKNYARFEGRATPSEYWWFVLFYILIIFGTSLVGGVVAGLLGRHGGEVVSGVFALLFVVILLGLILPMLAVTIRRLHDTNHSGAWLLLHFVPFGGIVLLVWYCTSGTPGPNKYGNRDVVDIANTF